MTKSDRMQPMSLAVALVAACMAISSPAAAQEPNFTIRVPVSLSEIRPEQTRFSVTCTLFAGGTVATYPVSAPPVLLSSDGSYSGPPIEVRIPLAGVPDSELLAIDTYVCTLRLYAASGSISVPALGHSDLALRPKSGTQFVKEVTGSIPSQK